MQYSKKTNTKFLYELAFAEETNDSKALGPDNNIHFHIILQGSAV